MTDFMRSRKMDEDIAEDKNFDVREWIDGSYLYRF